MVTASHPSGRNIEQKAWNPAVKDNAKETGMDPLFSTKLVYTGEMNT